MTTVNKNFKVKNGLQIDPLTTAGFLINDATGIVSSVPSITDVTTYVKNNTGSTLHKGQPVYISGATGANALISLSSSSSESTSSKTLGLLAQDLTTGSSGYVITNGTITGIDTSAWTEGTAIWLGSTAGTLSSTKAVAPNHLVYIGVVTRSHAVVGEILIKVQNGFELDELHSVLLDATASIADNEVLAFDSASGLWKNQTAVEAGLIDTSSTAQTKTGAFTSSGDITSGGVLKSTQSSANEGGQIELSLPSSGSTLSGTNVTIDVYQDKIRFFESGGTNRGAYIPLTSTGATVGTSLLGGTTGAMNYAQTIGTKQSAISTAGTTIVSVSITTNGYPIQVAVTGDMENNTAGGWVVLQLYRGSTAIGNPVHAESSAGSENVPYALQVIDTPAAGTYTYALKLNNSAGGTFNFGESNGPVITAVELSGPKGDTGAAGSGGGATTYGLTFGTSGLTATTGTSPWTGSAAATIDIDTSKVPLLSSANTFTGVTSITNSTSSTNSTTGALKVTGGIGVAENINAGGSIYAPNITAGTYLYTDSINVYSAPNANKFIYYSLGSGTIYLGGSNSPIIAGNSITASSFVKSGGTSSQYLMADGSTSTGGGFVDYQALTLSYR